MQQPRGLSKITELSAMGPVTGLSAIGSSACARTAIPAPQWSKLLQGEHLRA